MPARIPATSYSAGKAFITSPQKRKIVLLFILPGNHLVILFANPAVANRPQKRVEAKLQHKD